MQPNVDVVDIVQIVELATAAGVDLTWLIPVSSSTVPGSKKMNIQALATIISNQIGSVTVPDPYTYRVGGPGTHDPVAGATTINDPVLDGLEYAIDKWGVGYIRKGTDWQNDVSGGGFRLIGATFVAGETYVAIPKPKISNILSSPDAVARFTNGIQLLPSSTTIGAGMYRKLLIMNGAAVVTLPLCSSYPPNVALFISTTEGPRKESTIQTQGGNLIYSQGGILNKIFIGQREFVVFITDGTSWYIQSCSQRIFEQPTLANTWSWTGNTGALNTLAAVGGTALRTDLPGVWDFIQKLAVAVPSAVTTGGLWPSNKTLWGTGDGSTTFNIPDFRGWFTRFLDLGAGNDPDRTALQEVIPGNPQGFQMQRHNHTLTTIGQGNISALAQTFMIMGTKHPTQGNLTPSIIVGDAGGNETRGMNVGFYPLIQI